MNFKGICFVLGYEELVDVAFGRASKKIPAEKVEFVSKTIRKHLSKVTRSWPNLDELPLFYNELINITIDTDELNNALTALKKSEMVIHKLEKTFQKKLRKRLNNDAAYQIRKVYYGRVKATLKRIRRELEFLAESRKRLIEFPEIEDEFTTVIVGLPNVGKSSILQAMTNASPRVEPYPFTTQSMLLGYFEAKHLRYQVIDTPGLLDRPLKERNPIERQAILSLRHLANIVIYIFDPTERCGFTKKEQLNVFQELVKNFNVKVIPLVNKIDLHGEQEGTEFLNSLNLDGFKCSAIGKTGIDELREEIMNCRSSYKE